MIFYSMYAEDIIPVKFCHKNKWDKYYFKQVNKFPEKK